MHILIKILKFGDNSGILQRRICSDFLKTFISFFMILIMIQVSEIVLFLLKKKNYLKKALPTTLKASKCNFLA